MHSTWTIEGANGQPIRGDAHAPESPIGVVLIIHGFLGFKDYGMFPFLARQFCDAGFIAHRFNLSHAGVTEDSSTFARPDLFEQDTWNKQVYDVGAVMDAVDRGELAGAGLPIVLLGHSRGGVTALLTAGRRFRDGRTPLPAGVIIVAAPERADRVTDDARRSFEERGFHEVVSNRTKQTLRIDAAWLREQMEAPADHDVLGLCAHTTCPVLIMHGTDDETVLHESADAIAAACAKATMRKLEAANHVLNTVHPMGDAAPSAALEAFTRDSLAFAKSLDAVGR